MKSWFACIVLLAMLWGCKKGNDPMKSIYLRFHDDKWVSYYGGSYKENVDISGKAEIFDVNLFYLRTFGLVYRWDDSEETVIMSLQGNPDILPRLFPEDAKLKLDKNGYSYLDTTVEALATRKSGTMRFHYQHEGKEYTFVLKQMWSYADGNGPKQVKYVVF